MKTIYKKTINRSMFQDLKRQLVFLGWRTYINPIPNRMHEFTNYKKIVSFSVTAQGIVSVIRLRDFDIPNGVKINPNISQNTLIKKIS